MKTICPYCNYHATDHTNLRKPSIPKNEDISFCIECGEVSQYKDKNLIKVNLDELDEDTKTEINDVRVAWLKLRARMQLKKDKS